LTYRVESANRRVEKQILRLPRQVRNRVARAILELEANPRPHRCKKLVDDIYRVRVGRYRVIYKIFDLGKLVLIGKVARRSEDTYSDIEELF
jgi:mRNA interferase RelE/StbE